MNIPVVQDRPGNKKRFPMRATWIGVVFILAVSAIGAYFFMTHGLDAAAGNAEKVKLGISRSFLSIPVYIAQKQGYFEKEGLDVTIREYDSGKASAGSMFKEEIDISTVADMSVVFNSFLRDDFCVISTFTSSYDFIKIIARKDRGIKTGADLKGKKVGVNIGTSSHFFLGVFLIHNRLSISEAEMINIGTLDLPAALKNDEVDAISVWEPYAQEARQLLQDNAIELPGSEIYRTTFNFAVLKSFAQDNQETVKRFLRAIDRACAFIKSNREESQQIIAANFNIDKEIVNMLWDGYIFELSLDQALLASWDDIARWAIKNRLTDKKTIANYLKFIHLDALAAVKPEAVTIIH